VGVPGKLLAVAVEGGAGQRVPDGVVDGAEGVVVLVGKERVGISAGGARVHHKPSTVADIGGQRRGVRVWVVGRDLDGQP
jgi:hypothetical protein